MSPKNQELLRRMKAQGAALQNSPASPNSWNLPSVEALVASGQDLAEQDLLFKKTVPEYDGVF